MSYPPAPVDLTAQSFEQIGQKLDFIDDNKPAYLLIEIKIRLPQHLTIRHPLHIEIDRIAAFCDVLRKGRFADLSWTKQGDTSLGFQGPFNPLSVTALDYTLHLSNAMEDLQDLRRVQHRDGDARYAYLSSVKPASHFPAAAGPAATPE